MTVLMHCVLVRHVGQTCDKMNFSLRLYIFCIKGPPPPPPHTHTHSFVSSMCLCFPSQSWPTLQVPRHRDKSLWTLPWTLPASHAEWQERFCCIPSRHPSHPQPFCHVRQGTLRQHQEAGRWAASQGGDGGAQQGIRQDQDSLWLIVSLPAITSVLSPFSCLGFCPSLGWFKLIVSLLRLLLSFPLALDSVLWMV